ncbi:MAG: hypothetical protein KJO12_09560 [Ignavibacteria bacterium]|nr:hypothetical protein [Ignavibacteria bacterium]
MLRKIYIIGLLISFLFSTTGFSITQHFCKMMEETFADECSMCMDTNIPESMSCCEEDNFTGEIYTSGNFSDCCDTQVIENKVEDEFIYLNVEVKNDLTSSIVELPLSILTNDNEIVKSQSLYAFNSSPPSRGNDIYIYNSVLII